MFFGPGTEAARETSKEREAASLATVFGSAYAIEWLLWRRAPFVGPDFAPALAATVLLAAVPWIKARGRAPVETRLAVRRRVAFAIPALVLHLGAFAFFGPHWRSGPSASQLDLWAIVTAMASETRMAVHLTEAVRNDRLRDAAFLLRLGANASTPDAEGHYPLEEVRTPELLALLEAHGASITGADSGNALYRIADRGDVTLMRAALAAGADPNASAPLFAANRALHIAAYLDHPEVVRALLEAGADPQLRNGRGETALDVARRGRSDASVALLEAARPRR